MEQFSISDKTLWNIRVDITDTLYRFGTILFVFIQ